MLQLIVVQTAAASSARRTLAVLPLPRIRSLMTCNARQVLADCRVALSLLEDEKDLARWRVHWAAAVALLRAVGHVLDKVDGQDPVVKEAAEAAFRRWKASDPDNEIFREFIDRERNNLLKEYRSDVHPLGDVSIAIEYVAKSPSGDLVKMRHLGEISESIYRPMIEGPWVGDDARDVLAEAIDWWEGELDEIDEEVQSRRSR